MLTCISVERVHWLRSKAQFQWWMKEQDSIHNEAKWIPAYFHAKAETWRKLMHIAVKGSLKGHQAYASYQMHAWKELSQSSAHSLNTMQLNQFSWLDPHVLLVALYIVPTGGQSIHFISCQSSTLHVYIHSILFHLIIMQSTTSCETCRAAIIYLP